MEIQTSSFKIDVTPSLPCNVAGYGSLQSEVNQIFSPLEANVICFEVDQQKTALVQLDTLYGTSELTRTLEKKTGYKIILVASHTHNAPFLDPDKSRVGLFDQGYFDFLVEKISSQLLQSDKNSDAHISFGEAKADVSVFRRKKAFGVFRKFPFIARAIALLPNLKVEIDQRVTTFVFKTDEQVKAVIWRYTCHPVVTPQTNVISSDFPGEMRRLIREKYNNPSLPVVFLQGPTGDVRPYLQNQAGKVSLSRRLRFPFQCRFFQAPSVAEYKTFCQKLYTQVEQALDSSVKAESLPLNVKFSNHRIDSLTSFKGKKVDVPLAKLSGLASKKLIFVGAEISSQYQEILKKNIGSDIYICGYYSDVFGYLPTKQQNKEGGYEGSDFIPMFDLKGKFEPRFEENFLKDLNEVISGG